MLSDYVDADAVRWLWVSLNCFLVIRHRLPGDITCIVLFICSQLYLPLKFVVFSLIKGYKSWHKSYYYKIKETGPHKHRYIFIFLWWQNWRESREFLSNCLCLKSQMEEICLTPKTISYCLWFLIRHFLSFADLLVWNYLLA